MLELFLAFFILGYLSLAFREGSYEQQMRDERYFRDGLPDDFDKSVYEPLPVAEQEYLDRRGLERAIETNLLAVNHLDAIAAIALLSKEAETMSSSTGPQTTELELSSGVSA